MASDRTILITGVTGNQGGAVAKAMQGAGFNLRGLTRKPDGDRAGALARNGVEINAWKDLAENLPGVHAPSGPGDARRRSQSKIVLGISNE